MFAGIQYVLSAVIYLSLSPVYRSLQRLIWIISGIQASRDAAAAGTCYERSVHVQKIFWKKKVRSIETGDTSDFWTIHEKFDHPKILTDASISLYGLTLTEAVFLKTNKQVDIYSSDIHPFMKWSQFDHAERFYTIPIEAFHRLAEEVGDPKLPVIWLWSIGRCGSTLLGQILEKIPGTISLGEPDAITALSYQSKREQISEEESSRLLRSVVRLQCKTLPGTQRIVFKVTAFTFSEIKEIHQMFPSIHHVFLYRDILPYAKSSKTLIKHTFKWFTMTKKDLYKIIRIDRHDHFLEDSALTLTFVGLWVILAISIIKRYKELWDEKIPMFAILYEDLIGAKEEIVTEMFKKLDIPAKYVPQAMTAFDVDSHRGFTSNRKRKDVKEDLTLQEVRDTNMVLERYGFPYCNRSIDLPGRIKPTA